MQAFDVLLLTGGESTRFWPFYSKNLTIFLGKPLLWWHYEQLVRLGIEQVIVVTNKDSYDAIKSVPVSKKLRVTYVTQEGKGQRNAVVSGGKNSDEKPLLIINGSDIYEDSLLKDLLTAQKSHPDTLKIAARRMTSYFPGGYLKLNEQGSVVGIVEKPGRGQEPSDLVKLVVDIIPNAKTFLDLLKQYGKHVGTGYEDALTKYLEKGGKAESIVTETDWLFLKYPWHILPMMDACLETIKDRHVGNRVTIARDAVIEGPVIIEDEVKICEGVKIVGPTFIGKGTVVGNNTMIRRSYIGEHSVTGFNTDITRSYIGNNCWFHTNFVGDSVIGNNVSMGSGTVLANLRLDEGMITSKVKGQKTDTGRVKLGAMIGDNVRIGVNVSIMPGIKIGKNSFIGAGVVLGQDITEGMYCTASQSLVIRKNVKETAKSREEFKKAL